MAKSISDKINRCSVVDQCLTTGVRQNERDGIKQHRGCSGQLAIRIQFGATSQLYAAILGAMIFTVAPEASPLGENGASELHSAVATLINGILAGGNSVRRRQCEPVACVIKGCPFTS